MNGNKKPLGSDLSRSDAHLIQPEEYEELPELTQEMLEAADFYRNGTLVRRGRPPKKNAKLAIKLRLDPDVIAAFRESGAGWQTRINTILREHMPK